MDNRIKHWRADVEEAIRENDPIHLRIVLDRVFSEIEEEVEGFDPSDFDE